MRVLLVTLSLVFLGLTAWASTDSQDEKNDQMTQASTRNFDDCGDKVKCGHATTHALADPQGQSESYSSNRNSPAKAEQ
ncbi:hypothetical protein N9W41_00920 [bacterium]|nr:hypothetical protein [bacterium]